MFVVVCILDSVSSAIDGATDNDILRILSLKQQGTGIFASTFTTSKVCQISEYVSSRSGEVNQLKLNSRDQKEMYFQSSILLVCRDWGD